MPTFGEVVYSIQDIWVASLSAAGTYGTPVKLDYPQKVEFKPAADTDMLKAGGMGVELLTVPTHVEGTIGLGALDLDGIAVLIGQSATTSGTTPNQQRTLIVVAGGAGLPYWGMIGRMASPGGADKLIGLPKCMLDNPPQFMAEQNKFALPETGFKSVAASSSTGKLLYIQDRETAATGTPNFGTFFA